ncbi:MAG: hypothetical protein FIA95_04660 [Gemmatimonadetes bacterium]|nr:hypothetical protein [Gemmatimonadota bacterium]
MAVCVAAALAACGAPAENAGKDAAASSAPSPNWDVVQDSTRRVARIEGLSSPEAVRYDPDQDVWFIANMDGAGDERDGDGFVSRVAAGSGRIESLRFAQGTALHPLHAPRGMTLAGDTLWVVDIDGLHGFHRASGERLAFVDMTHLRPGFLNDVARAPDGALYVTDSEKSSVYRVAGREASVALADSVLGNPNGITWDEARGVLVLVPWKAGSRVIAWRAGGTALEPFGPTRTPGGLDGVEPFQRRLLVASQSDSSIVLMDAGETVSVIRTPGRPADIGVDTRRGRIAVPYIALDRVDVWALPLR